VRLKAKIHQTVNLIAEAAEIMCRIKINAYSLAEIVNSTTDLLKEVNHLRISAAHLSGKLKYFKHIFLKSINSSVATLFDKKKLHFNPKNDAIEILLILLTRNIQPCLLSDNKLTLSRFLFTCSNVGAVLKVYK